MFKLNGHKPTKQAPDDALDDGDAIETVMRKHYPNLMQIAYADADAIAGIDVVFDLANPLIQDVLDGLAKQVRGVADTTKQQIGELVGRQAEEGWSNERLQREIRKLGFTESRQRALLIARTESASGYTQGSIAAYQQSGVVSSTEWLASGDSCPICEDLNGQRAELGGEFAPGISGPPAHPRCTCVISPIVE